jgi:hypothetical protein
MVSTVPVTGSIVLPDGSAFSGGVLYFTLSGPDTEDDVAVAGEYMTGLVGTSIPAGFEVWRNTAGVRGTSYQIKVLALVTLANGDTVRRPYVLGYGYVGDAASYTIAEVLAGDGSYTPASGRAALVQRIADGWVPAPDMIVFGGALAYIGVAGSTEIADLPGLEPAGAVRPEHWKDNTNPGTTLMASPINQAMAYAASHGIGEVICAGLYNVNGTTLVHTAGTYLKGDSREDTKFIRDDGHGDTLTATSVIGGIENIWFVHGTYTAQLDPGVVTELDNRLADGSAHIRLTSVSRFTIKNCRIHRMPYGIVLDDARNVTIEDTETAGTWHPTIADLQETVAAVWAGGAETRYNQILRVINNRHVGSVGPQEDTDYTDGVSTKTREAEEGNFGPKYHWLINNIEMMWAHGNYLNRSSSNLVMVDLTQEWPCYALNWAFNTFDAGSSDIGEGDNCQVAISDRIENRQIRQINISANQFILGSKAVHGLYIAGRNAAPTEPTAYAVNVTGNQFLGGIGCPARFEGVNGLSFTGNTVTGYNWLDFGDGLPYGTGVGEYEYNPLYVAGVYIGEDCSHVVITGNTIGGGSTNFANAAAKGFWGIYLQDPDDEEVVIGDNVYGYLNDLGVRCNTTFNRMISTANGYYRRTYDGFMECWGAATLAYANATYLTKTIAWPKQFVSGEVPVFMWTPSWDDLDSYNMASKVCGPTNGTVNNVAGVARLARVNGQTNWADPTDIDFTWRAVGRWRAAV